MILVHGAWHGAWCWRHVKPLLETVGLTVDAPDLPGHTGNLDDMSMMHYEQALSQLILQRNKPVTLVGHSLAGLLITRLAHLYPNRVKRLVYIAAFIGHSNQSLMNCMFLADDPPKPNLAIATEAEGQIMTLRPTYAKDIFYHQCSEADQEFAVSHVCAQKTDTFKTPIEYDPDTIAVIPKDYLLCTEDKAVEPALQEKMAKIIGANIHLLNSDHSPFFSHPQALVDYLAK